MLPIHEMDDNNNIKLKRSNLICQTHKVYGSAQSFKNGKCPEYKKGGEYCVVYNQGEFWDAKAGRDVPFQKSIYQD